MMGFSIVPIIIFGVIFLIVLISTIFSIANHQKLTKSVTSKIFDTLNANADELNNLDKLDKTNEKQTNYCQYCRSKISEADIKCNSCGAKLHK